MIARLGAITFFEMLMKNNFIHADCHGGNIIVEIQERYYNFFTEIMDFVREKYRKVEEYFTLKSLNSDLLRRLFVESKK